MINPGGSLNLPEHNVLCSHQLQRDLDRHRALQVRLFAVLEAVRLPRVAVGAHAGARRRPIRDGDTSEPAPERRPVFDALTHAAHQHGHEVDDWVCGVERLGRHRQLQFLQ